MEEQDYIQFEDYLAGNLSNEDLLAFNKRLESDALFNKTFEVYKDMSSHLKHEIANEQETSDFKANLDVISNMHFNTLDDLENTDNTIRQPNFYKYAIAASVVILLGFFIFNQFGEPSYEDFNNFDPISLTVRSADDANLSKAEQSFNTKNYNDAINAFNAILETDFANLEVQLYKSMALIETNQFEEADHLLNKLSKGHSAYKNKAKWLLALSYLKQEKTAGCIEILQTIPEDAEDYKTAQKLLNKLN
ncbi:tetratricopeptide repeat protein [Winogradskyella sp. PC D3.3]